jgi:hypothetical protein
VRAIIDKMNEEVKSTVEKELENNTYVAAAMLKMLFSQVGLCQCVSDWVHVDHADCNQLVSSPGVKPLVTKDAL